MPTTSIRGLLGLFAALTNAFAYGFFIRPETPREFFVNDRNTRRVFRVLFSEATPLEQRDIHSAEVIRACGGSFRQRRLARFRSAADRQSQKKSASRCFRAAGPKKARQFNAGQRANLLVT